MFLLLFWNVWFCFFRLFFDCGLGFWLFIFWKGLFWFECFVNGFFWWLSGFWKFFFCWLGIGFLVDILGCFILVVCCNNVLINVIVGFRVGFIWFIIRGGFIIGSGKEIGGFMCGFWFIGFLGFIMCFWFMGFIGFIGFICLGGFWFIWCFGFCMRFIFILL